MAAARARRGTVAELFPHQVAGHGVLLRYHGKVAKPSIPQEKAFYENDEARRIFGKFMCTYYGTEVLRQMLSGRHEEGPVYQEHLLLEDITQGFEKPCILDIKMGQRQHGDDASEEKKRKMIAKCARTTSALLGVRLCGLRVYNLSDESYSFRDKHYGRRLDEEGFAKAIEEYSSCDGSVLSGVVLKFLEKLREMEQTFRHQKSFRLYSTSLLFVYEGGCSPDSDAKADVRIIDFAHSNALTDENKDVDHGYLVGLSTMVRCFERVLAENKN